MSKHVPRISARAAPSLASQRPDRAFSIRTGPYPACSAAPPGQGSGRSIWQILILALG